MTNTRLTDPEILERRYPVRLLEFSIRRGSGGSGIQRGGDGAVRRIEFLEPLEVSLVTSRRGPYPPYGLAGGQPGALGRNMLIRADGSRESLGSQARLCVEPGDQLIIETPGGGGWGAPRDRSPPVENGDWLRSQRDPCASSNGRGEGACPHFRPATGHRLSQREPGQAPALRSGASPLPSSSNRAANPASYLEPEAWGLSPPHSSICGATSAVP